ncbi:MAG: type II toxin-antitoxin system HicB family antitoxin [Bacteroidales bacterium]|nr:type II toxin-antitoxin system HicB family antitoxin [Bacteroidales bacterium]
MNTLKYKGYIGSVAYSEPDKVFFGKLEGIDALVNYEGESVAELTAAFHEAVDDYLALCEDIGQKPEKSYTGTFNVRISPATHRQIANRAMEAGISINAFVKKVLDEAVQQPLPAPEPAMLMEPDSPGYGIKGNIGFSVPSKDVDFAKELAKHLGWKEV